MTDGRHGCSADESFDCPLCLEPLDDTERSFKPCPCGYQMCTFCWDRVSSDKCPACRRSYDPNSYTWIEVSRLPRSGEKRGHKNKTSSSSSAFKSKKSLFNLRVIQRNLVYVKNLALEVAKEETLRQQEYFGQYGKIIKMVINRSHIYQGTSVSCYVTYSTPEEAYSCVKSIDGFELKQRKLRASFGTTKYCSYFLRNKACTNSECMYLHAMSDKEDNFTKEDMQVGRHLLRVPSFVPLSQTDPSYVQLVRNGFPPPKQTESSFDKDQEAILETTGRSVSPHRDGSARTDAFSSTSSEDSSYSRLTKSGSVPSSIQSENQYGAYSRDSVNSNRVKGVTNLKNVGFLPTNVPEGLFATSMYARNCPKSKIKGFKKYVPKPRHEGQTDVSAPSISRLGDQTSNECVNFERNHFQRCADEGGSNESNGNDGSALDIPGVEERSTDSVASSGGENRASSAEMLRHALPPNARMSSRSPLTRTKDDRLPQARRKLLLESGSSIESKTERMHSSKPSLEHQTIKNAKNPELSIPAGKDMRHAEDKKFAYSNASFSERPSIPSGALWNFFQNTQRTYDGWNRVSSREESFQSGEAPNSTNYNFEHSPANLEATSYLPDSLQFDTRGSAYEEPGYSMTTSTAFQKPDSSQYTCLPSYFYPQFDEKSPFSLDSHPLHYSGDFNFHTGLGVSPSGQSGLNITPSRDAATTPQREFDLPRDRSRELIDSTHRNVDSGNASVALISDSFPSERLVHGHCQNYVSNESSIVVDDLNLSSIQVQVPRSLVREPRFASCSDAIRSLSIDQNLTHYASSSLGAVSTNFVWPKEPRLRANTVTYSSQHDCAPSGNEQLYGTSSSAITSSNPPSYEHSYGKLTNTISSLTTGCDEYGPANQKHDVTRVDYDPSAFHKDRPISPINSAKNTTETTYTHQSSPPPPLFALYKDLDSTIVDPIGHHSILPTSGPGSETSSISPNPISRESNGADIAKLTSYHDHYSSNVMDIRDDDSASALPTNEGYRSLLNSKQRKSPDRVLFTHLSGFSPVTFPPSETSCPTSTDHSIYSQHQKKTAQPYNFHFSQLRCPVGKTFSEPVAPVQAHRSESDPYRSDSDYRRVQGPKPSPTYSPRSNLSVIRPLSNGHTLTQHNIWTTPSVDDKRDTPDQFLPIDQRPGQFILYSLGQNRALSSSTPLSHHISPNNP